jgi:hypothetical protein
VNSPGTAVIEAIIGTGTLACLVRLSEFHRDQAVVTTDGADFRIYRRFVRQAIPLRVP